MIEKFDKGYYGRLKEGPLKGPGCRTCYREEHPPVLEVIHGYDWNCAHEYAAWLPEDVAEILAVSEGEPDEEDWLLLCRLSNGRFGGLSAGCDYTGWD